MELLWMFAIARPWHYWLGGAFAAAGAMSLLAIAVGYYRQVLVPLYRYRSRQVVWSSGAPARAPAGDRHRLRSSPPPRAVGSGVSRGRRLAPA